MKKVLCCAMLLLLTASGAWGQIGGEVFGGYAYERLPSTGSVTHLNLNGWEGALTVKRHWLGVTADISDVYSTPTIAGVNVRVHQTNYLFGPQVSVHVGPLSPFVHALFGVSHLNQQVQNGGAASTHNVFAGAFGGGLDLQVAPHVAVRVAQVDYLRTTYASDGQNNVRIATGVVLRF